MNATAVRSAQKRMCNAVFRNRESEELRLTRATMSGGPCYLLDMFDTYCDDLYNGYDDMDRVYDCYNGDYVSADDMHCDALEARLIEFGDSKLHGWKDYKRCAGRGWKAITRARKQWGTFRVKRVARTMRVVDMHYAARSESNYSTAHNEVKTARFFHEYWDDRTQLLACGHGKGWYYHREKFTKAERHSKIWRQMLAETPEPLNCWQQCEADADAFDWEKDLKEDNYVRGHYHKDYQGFWFRVLGDGNKEYYHRGVRPTNGRD